MIFQCLTLNFCVRGGGSTEGLRRDLDIIADRMDFGTAWGNRFNMTGKIKPYLRIANTNEVVVKSNRTLWIQSKVGLTIEEKVAWYLNKGTGYPQLWENKQEFCDVPGPIVRCPKKWTELYPDSSTV